MLTAIYWLGSNYCPGKQVAVEQIASPVTGICPRSENLKFYMNYVHSDKNLQSIGLDLTIDLENNGIVFPALPVPTPICPNPIKIS